MQPPVGQRPSLKLPVRRTGSVAVMFHLERIQRSITDRPGRALSVSIAVAVGLSLAITIISASHSIDTQVSKQLDPLSNNSNGNFQQNIDTIHSVLAQTRDLLTKLSIGFTAALVGLITWVTMGQRRRDIGIALQQGEHRSTVIMELLGEAFLLCIIGGIAGIILGNVLCSVITNQLPLLPMSVDNNDIPPIFLATILLSFAVTGVIATYLANQRDTSVGL